MTRRVMFSFPSADLPALRAHLAGRCVMLTKAYLLSLDIRDTPRLRRHAGEDDGEASVRATGGARGWPRRQAVAAEVHCVAPCGRREQREHSESSPSMTIARVECLAAWPAWLLCHGLGRPGQGGAGRGVAGGLLRHGDPGGPAGSAASATRQSRDFPTRGGIGPSRASNGLKAHANGVLKIIT